MTLDKPKLDPAGLERAANEFFSRAGIACNSSAAVAATKAIITAYLTPESEIEVTEEMRRVGVETFSVNRFHLNGAEPEKSLIPAYKAMAALDPARKSACEHSWESGWWSTDAFVHKSFRRCTKCAQMELL